MKTGIIEAIDQASSWLEFDGVEGVAEGNVDGKTCIVVLISVPVANLATEIPSTFLGYPVIFDDSGTIIAQ